MSKPSPVKRFWILSLAVAATAAIGVVMMRNEPPATIGPTNKSSSEQTPPESPLSLAALERALIEAGRIEDPELRDLRTREIGEDLIDFHVAAEVREREEAETRRKAEQARLPSANQPDERERSYDLAKLRAEFEEALRTKDGHLRRLAIGAVAEFLAVHDPDVAALWMKELLQANQQQGSGSNAYYFASFFTQTYARTDLAAAAKWAEILPAETLRPVAHQYIAREWTPRDLSAVETWIASIEDARLRSNAIRTVGNALEVADDSTASEWAQRLAGNKLEGARHSDVVVQHWGRTDIDGAIEWTRSLSHEDDIHRAVTGLATAFAAREPQAAAAWAQDFPPGPARDQAITISANRWGVEDPPRVAAWLAGLEQGRLLAASFPSVAASWYAKDPASAIEWMRTAPVDDDLRTYVQKLVVADQVPVAANR
jgi:hypothetical protein